MKAVTRDELATMLEDGRMLVVTPRYFELPELADAFPAVVCGGNARSVIGDFDWEFDAKDFAPRDMFYVYDYADLRKAQNRIEEVIKADLSRLTIGM